MSDFKYRNGVLHVEGVRLDELAEAAGTPCWVYSATALTARYRQFAAAFKGFDATICYSLKANSNQGIIATFARLGAGADVVSGGELKRALAAGIPARKIVFAGVGKTDDELAAALDAGIFQINVESEPELRHLSRLAAARKRKAPVTLRVNPDIDAGTHAKITTGTKENKFGIDIAHAADIARTAASLPGIDLQGLAVHIGSQLTRVDPFAAAFTRLGELARDLAAAGHRLRHLDFGGGLGVTYDGESPPPLDAYAAAVRRTLDLLPNRGKGVSVVLAPGRWLVAGAGLLLSRVIYRKSGVAKRFIIIDAAMNDLIRPSLYDAIHPVKPVIEPKPDVRWLEADIVGPVCETGDILAAARPMPPLAEGDLLAIEVAGAYGAVMSSTYNTRPLAPELLVKGTRWSVIRPRQSVESLLRADRLPTWLGHRARNKTRPKGVYRQAAKKRSRRRKK